MKPLFIFTALLSGLVFAGPISAAPQALAASPTVGVGLNIPSTPAWTALGNYRAEFRVHNCTGGRYIFEGNWMALQFYPNCSTIGFSDGNGNGITLSVPGGATDVIGRVTRVSNGTTTFEVWNTATGAYTSATMTTSGTVNASGTYNLLGIGASVDIDYLRFFSTQATIGIIPSANPGGDLLDLELDGGINDSSPNAVPTAALGTAAFVNTPLYGPTAGILFGPGCFNSTSSSPNFCVVAAGSTLTLTAAAATPNQGDSLTYAWTQTSGTPVTISNANTPAATVNNISSFGEYDFKLTVTDQESNQATGTEQVGAVLTTGKPGTSACLINDVPPNLQRLIGPLTQWGSSCDPWPWYDMAEIGNANAIMNSYFPPPSGNTAAAGTIVFSSAVLPTVTGTGTAFTTLAHSCDNNNCATGHDEGLYLTVWWNAEGGTGTGRWIFNVPASGITNNTTLHPSFYQLPSVITPGVSYQYAWVNANDYWTPFSLVSQPSYNWNYYDDVIAFYRLYYRTGITAYLTFARRLADDWWTYAMDHGYAEEMVAPRAWSLAGMMARIIDGNFQARWGGIESVIVNHLPIYPAVSGQVDVRETGYASSFLGLTTQLDPNITGATKTAYCSYVSESLNTFWAPLLTNDSAYGQNPFLVNQSYPNYGNEVEPWQLAITGTGFRDLYLAAANTCNDSASATTAKNLLEQTLTFMYFYGAQGTRSIPGPNGGGTGHVGMAYFVGAPATGETPHNSCLGPVAQFSAPCVPGTVSGTQASISLVGTGTTFVSGGVFACNGTDFIGIITENPPTVHRVVSCADDTHITLAPADPLVSNVSSSYFDESGTDASTSCLPSMSQYCYFQGGSAPTPDITLDNSGIFGWLYNLTNDDQWIRYGDDLFSSWAGGPAGGPGTLGPPAGPMASGQLTSAYGYLSALPSCSSAAPPCGGVTNPGSVPVHWGKDFGIGSGWVGAADNYFAYRLLGPPKVCCIP